MRANTHTTRAPFAALASIFLALVIGSAPVAAMLALADKMEAFK